MRRRALSFLASLACAIGMQSPAQAANPADAPTVFDHAYQGLLVGALAGTATGYLFARQDGWKGSSDWKPLAYGAGIGAIAGGTIGLTLSIVDLQQNKIGRHGYVMRNGLLGAGFGATIGGLAGALGTISSGKGEHILLGASIGTLSGTCLGMTLGIITGYQKTRVAILPVQDTRGSFAYLPAVSGQF